MSSPVSTGLPLAYADRLAAMLVERLAPGCARIEVAGSVRRRKEAVKDIELVCIPKRDPTNRLETLLNVLLTTCDRPIFRSRRDLLTAMGRPVDNGPDVRRWGERYRRFYLWGNDRYGVVAVDLFLATVDNWGAIFAIRTGPDDFSKALVTHIKYKTPYRQRDGVLVRQFSGEVVPVREEKDYFRLAGMPWIEPERRTVASLRRVARGNA
jgi:DNA polymerase/3'-5' exonuclease PolX